MSVNKGSPWPSPSKHITLAMSVDNGWLWSPLSKHITLAMWPLCDTPYQTNGHTHNEQETMYKPVSTWRIRDKVYLFRKALAWVHQDLPGTLITLIRGWLRYGTSLCEHPALGVTESDWNTCERQRWHCSFILTPTQHIINVDKFVRRVQGQHVAHHTHTHNTEKK